jgi:hypothetical protein
LPNAVHQDLELGFAAPALAGLKIVDVGRQFDAHRCLRRVGKVAALFHAGDHAVQVAFGNVHGPGFANVVAEPHPGQDVSGGGGKGVDPLLPGRLFDLRARRRVCFDH